MFSRSIITLVLGLLVAATTAQDVVLVPKGVKPPTRQPKPARQGAQHPDEEFFRVMSKVPDDTTGQAEENHMGAYSKSGAPFKTRVGEMSIYLQKVEATFDQIYYEQYLEELKIEAASAISAGSMTEPGEFAPTIARPSKTVLTFDRTVTSPSRVTTTSTYSADNPGAACGAWVSLVRYCGTTETNKESFSECYCTSGTDNVPDQWNSLAARCATAKYKCKDSTDYRCELTDQASSFTDFCDTDGATVRFHTDKKTTIARQTTDDSWMGSSASDDDEDEDDSSDQESSDDSESGGSSDDSAAEAAKAQPKPTSSATQAPLTTTSASPGSTRTANANTSRTSSSSVSSTPPSATSTSSAQSASTRMSMLVFRAAQSWLLGVCALWLL